MSEIHPTAIVEDGASVGEGSVIGPYCIVGPNVVLGKGVKLEAHVVVTGHTSVGAGTHIFPFASIGHKPQDLKFAGEITKLEIGENNQIREHVTMNPGTEHGGGLTKVGNNCLFMMGAHVGHDCLVGDHAILANNATLAGHVELESHVIMGGLSAIRQWSRIGSGAIIGGMAGVEFDVIPFGAVTGNRATLDGLNLIGLKRTGVPREDIHALRAAYRQLFEAAEGTLRERAENMLGEAQTQPLVKQVVDFILARENRKFCTPRGSD
ncbi:MAG: acyl-ACP--UDP-N-acetylglucosamine O-acyltransferase [Rhodobacteraceae bacterium]|nr:acyl-ACP--UDP-N-acetylglucosamine O-acyltransferase [Paracoccaceae bacterium]